MTGQPPNTVIELRRYTLHPGRREELIELFEREFVEPQEAAGMSIIGQFRDLDHPDTFTWLRGFRDMTARRRALDTFYGGAVWAAHRAAANATMIDSDDVHLLRPSPSPPSAPPSSPATSPATARQVAIVVCRLVRSTPADRARAHALLHADGWTRVAAMETLPVVNDVPWLPVNDDDVVVAVLATEQRSPSPLDAAAITDAGHGLVTHTSVFRLVPTDRSRLR